MMKKLGIVMMAGLFTVSVAGLSFADEKAAPSPAVIGTPALPDVRKEVKEEMKSIKGKAKQMKEQATTAVTPPIVGPVPTETPALPDVRKEVKEEMKSIKGKAKQMKEQATTAVTPPIVGPVPTPIPPASGEKK
ncbi:MAG: hypothetical protein M5R38_03135 [Candidatus Methylomirabilis sp.]|nr:hypothetical protein [Candidatus Methylomirabilis sp.]